ncbi:hypothetical protein N9235_00720 [Gammaproteobacteria bacterium]|nr:hypothetical protein [Gammaproteobacteria bacterium]
MSKKKPNATTDEDKLLSARTVLRPTVQASVTLQEYGKAYSDLDFVGLINALSEQVELANSGNLCRSGGMLVAQAHTLDAIFNNLAQRAAMNLGASIEATETYLKLALRAQSQCRATWEAVSAIQNPPLAGYVKQANITHGPQQVNNGPAPEAETSRAGKSENPQNEQLEKKDGKRLDIGATGTPSRADQDMAPVGKVDRAKDSRG